MNHEIPVSRLSTRETSSLIPVPFGFRAGVTEFLTKMMDMVQPENLPDDYENNTDIDYKAIRIANINAASKACGELIAVRSCSPGVDAGLDMDVYDVCIKGEKQYFGLAAPVNKYPPGGIHNTPANQPDGIWILANGSCQCVLSAICLLCHIGQN